MEEVSTSASRTVAEDHVVVAVVVAVVEEGAAEEGASA